MNTTERKSWIPDVSKAEIERRAKRIKPVVRMGRFREKVTHDEAERSTTFEYIPDGRGKWQQSKQGDLCYIKPVDLFGIAYTWDPKPLAKAPLLVPVRDIRTYHTYGYYGMFKPSIAEVLAQIPDELLNEVDAFEIIDSPETADDLNRESEALNAGYHVATTRLYAKK